jgi:hypothetical protein
MNHTHTIIHAGCWLYVKARRQARESGVRHAANLLKKQGVPLELALSILRTVRQA